MSKGSDSSGGSSLAPAVLSRLWDSTNKSVETVFVRRLLRERCYFVGAPDAGRTEGLGAKASLQPGEERQPDGGSVSRTLDGTPRRLAFNHCVFDQEILVNIRSVAKPAVATSGKFTPYERESRRRGRLATPRRVTVSTEAFRRVRVRRVVDAVPARRVTLGAGVVL